MKAEPGTKTQGPCPAPEDLAAAVLDLTAGASADAVREHAATCTRCRELLDGFAGTVQALRQTAPDAPEQDLLPGIMARIPGRAWREPGPDDNATPTLVAFPSIRLAGAAAALLLLAGAGWWLMQDRLRAPVTPSRDVTATAAVDRGVAWLLARQATDGGWSVEDLGGRAEYVPAVNGLALLALARAPSAGVELRLPLDSAVHFLVRTLDDEGRFGEACEGTMYNQGIATLALLETYSVTRDDRLREPLDRALAFIRARQSHAGGWGYSTDSDAVPNTSITAWQFQALLVADRLGWPGNRRLLRRALAWLSGTIGGDGYFGYERLQQYPEGPETLTMMGAQCLFAARRLDIPVDSALAERVMAGMGRLADEKPRDYYGAYFYSSALWEADPESYGDAVAAARSTLAKHQHVAGDDTGNWLADDRWGSTGGQIYSTAMALLALTPVR